MPANTREMMLQEAQLADRFTAMYHRQFAELIERLNQNLHLPQDRDGLRLCIEAVDMMLATQSYLTRVLVQLGAAGDTHRQAA